MKQLSLLFLCMVTGYQAGFAQCSVSGKTKVCLGDMASYELSGAAVSSAKWKFGDGFSSNDIKARHLYKKAGIFTVTCEAKLSSGAACTATLQVEVVGLPVAAFSRFGSRDSCQFVNNICFKDNSQPAAAGQHVVKRLAVWGDGSYDLSNNPGSHPDLCHTYNSSDNFRLKFEVTDIYGCKNSWQGRVRIIPGPGPILKHEVTWPECGKARVCFKNESDTPARSRNTYIWTLDGNGFSRSIKTTECFETQTGKMFKASLKVVTMGGCTAEISDSVIVDLRPPDTELKGYSQICYGAVAGPVFWISGDQGLNTKWYLDGDPIPGSGGDTLRLSPKTAGLKPGKYTVSVEVMKGPCIRKHSMEFTVVGPVAQFRMANRLQCEMKSKIFMWDVTALQDKSKAGWHWNIDDVDGEDCVAWRSRGQNLFKNCNESRDWYHKHTFDSTRRSIRSLVTMKVHDSITGCSDEASRLLKNCCGSFSKKNSYFEICQGDSFLPFNENSDPELEPVAFSLDTGRTFYPFPSRVFAPHQGLYGVYLVWRKARPDSAVDFGNDSLITYIDTTKGFDTLFYNGLLKVNPLPDTSFTVSYSGLNPKRVKLMPVSPQFRQGDRIIISWGDGTVTDTMFAAAGSLDSLIHLYRLHKFNGHISIQMISREGCDVYRTIPLGWGLEAAAKQRDYRCGSLQVCFEPSVLDYSSGSTWKEGDPGGHTFKWDFGDSSTGSSAFSPCHTYTRPGRYKVSMMVGDSAGNRDTATLAVIVQELVAGVTSESKEFYCSEIKQLFDSSYLRVYDPEDAITDYLWDFGEGTFTTIEKDPFHTFENGGTYNVAHVVKSKSGCTDTTNFVVKISGSEAAFDILSDTVGCAPFLVTFRNRSKNCKQYIWEYGDHENTTHSTGQTGNDTFRYMSHGRFSVKLIGIDTFYNPNTGNAYYCNSIYPPDDSARIITVLPSPKTGLMGPDTICAGSWAEFRSLSDPLYEVDEWQLDPDPAGYIDFTGMKKRRQYPTPGVYSVWLKPSYTIYPGQPRCFDSAVKRITVLGVTADFEIDPKSVDPVYTFRNRSNPIDAGFTWDFGQPNSPRNFSNEVHPTHDYYPERDTFTVCLLAEIPAGCRDTVCKTLIVNYFEDISLANVFTPNEDDDLNKDWDIFIDGEKLYQLRIFNRWGELVFESNKDAAPGEDGNWNGRVRNTGPECPEGTYFYQFTYAFSRGDQPVKTVSGSINLIRGGR